MVFHDTAGTVGAGMMATLLFFVVGVPFRVVLRFPAWAAALASLGCLVVWPWANGNFDDRPHALQWLGLSGAAWTLALLGLFVVPRLPAPGPRKSRLVPVGALVVALGSVVPGPLGLWKGTWSFVFIAPDFFRSLLYVGLGCLLMGLLRNRRWQREPAVATDAG